MTDHLPECGYMTEQPGFGGINSGIDSIQPYIPGSPCICDRLRACEQRVRADERQHMAAKYLVSDREQQEAEQRAYAAGLSAARDAIRNVPCPDGYEAKGCSHWDQVLAAIDALREEKQ